MDRGLEKELGRFAKGLMGLVRDQAIVECDRLASGVTVGPDGERWRLFLERGEAPRVVEAVIPDIVDQALFALLDAIDNGKFPLAWRSAGGRFVGLDELGGGEMGGWLMGSPGWRHEYSSQRFFDPESGWLMDRGLEKELGRFAKGLMGLVRDQAIVECDRLASGVTVGPDGERWRLFLERGEAPRVVEAVIPDIVDQALFALLDAIDNGKFPLAWRSAGGRFVGLDELGGGEMGGWLMGSPGWRHEYSSQRFFDPLFSLRLDAKNNLSLPSVEI